MYIILPGKLGYTESLKFLELTKKLTEEAAVIENVYWKAGKEIGITPDERIAECYRHADICTQFLKYCTEYGEGEMAETSNYPVIFTMLADREEFRNMVQKYYNIVSDALREIMLASSEQSLMVFGIEVLATYFFAGTDLAKYLSLEGIDFMLVNLLGQLYIKQS